MSDYIPEDIQLRILKHLPVPTLLRFRCVCKWWKQVIDSEEFIQEHLATQKPYLIVKYEASQYLVADLCKLLSFEILPSPIPKQLRLLGTLHGVICLYDEDCRKIVLWNPWIRKLMRVSSVGLSFDWDHYMFSVGPSSGFWIDPLTKEFKIIMFELFVDGEETDDFWLYSSARGDFKSFPLELELYYTMEAATAVVIDGVGHWTAYYDDDTDDEGKDMVGVVVLSFDFKKEMFLEPIEALGMEKGWSQPVLCNRDGALSLVYMDPENSYDVYSRKEDKWVLVHGFFLFPVLERFMWGVEDKETKIRVVAAIYGGLLSFEPDDMIFCCPLMIQLKGSSDVIANDFVASLLCPAAEC